MLRDTKILCRNENVPIDSSSSSTPNVDSDPNRPPLNAIQDPIFRRKVEKTPSKCQTRVFSEGQFRTPEKSKNRFGWVGGDSESSAHWPPSRNGVGCNFAGTTPRNHRAAGKASSVQSDCSSTQSTPTKSSVTKPTLSGIGSSRPPMSVGRAMVSKGMPMSGAGPLAYVAAEVPHFELREDPSFWMDHNVQVVIRVRPINSTERNLQGYSRCLKQESAQNITWIGQPEMRFTFDYIACETISQDVLFRVAGLPMVENCMSGYNSCMFAYGQTGSGKTYTMLGEIGEPELRPNADRGMTPRIFEFLFARIKAEEESRRDEKLKYNCKCSFLEIYNEQITDLLDPSSTNLLLREDTRKGVYVENLTEFEVETVNDILKLLFQGAANRRVAATNMNRESSRSHSVFTCVIESRWEKDSTTNLRFARLNLVDLAGSERQKTSGAEGERLKEAANINKSLSTLGHVIMILADAAHGKQRHVPYRDSRLTFLLQESLGGNSKTMIIANISPSICSANETLSTLKFAQRARLIQNNAVVNEDASGDISALQHQIRLLKEELLLLKHQNISRSLSFRKALIDNSKDEDGDDSVMEDLHGPSQLSGDEMHNFGSCRSVRVSTEQLKSLEATLAGALRREKMADITIKQLEAEIEQLNRLVRQREEDARSSKMMLKFREDRIHRMEALLDGQLSPDSYFFEENSAQTEEIQLLRARADRNPEVTRFALENIRLLDQLRRFQDFYEEGERELLLSEVAELRNQLILILDGKSVRDQQTNRDLQAHVEYENMDLCLDSPHSTPSSPSLVSHAEEVLNLQLELDILKIILGEEKSARIDLEKRAFEAESELRSANERIFQHKGIEDELKDARSVIEALESQHILSINELEELRESNKHFLELLKKQEQEMTILKKQTGDIDGEEKTASSCRMLKSQASKLTENEDSPLREKFRKIQASLEKARYLNARFQSDQVSQTSLEQEKDEVRRQVEVETTEAIVCLQEELVTLQHQVDESNRNEVMAKKNLITLETELKGLHESLSLVIGENERLQCLLAEKEHVLKSMSEDWERLAYEIAEVLSDGNISLEDVSNQVASISDSFPSSWVTEQVEKIIKSITEKDSIIDELQKCLEDAQNVKCDMEWKLRSLRGATLAITETQQKECSEKEREIAQLTSQLSLKMSIISELEKSISLGEKRLSEAGICATVAFIIVNRFSEINAAQLNEFAETLNQRDALLQGQVLCHVDAENQMQAMKSQLVQFQEQTHRLLIQMEQSQATVDKQVLAHLEIKDPMFYGDASNNLLEENVELNKFKMGVSTVLSCRSECAEQVSCPEEEFIEGADNGSEHRGGIEATGDTVPHEQYSIEGVSGRSTDKIVSQNKSQCEWLSCDVLDRETTITLLRKELKSALNSLKEVQAKMVKLLNEKEEIKQSEIQSQKNIEHLTAEVLRLKSEIIDKEQQFELRLLELEEKLQRVEESEAAANVRWHKMKEGLDSDVSNAKAIASQKTIEASNLLLKIEEVQETMRDADLMVNALMEANETAKLEIERLETIEATLNSEKSHLTSEVKTLQSFLDITRHDYESMKGNSLASLEEARSLFLALEDTISLLQGTFTEKFKLVQSDLDWLKSQLQSNTQSVRAWLEEIWSEIIGKDCAVSVLNLCHMGILLERITGLNAENGFLHRGLCESDSVVADLKKHNSKAKQELELCSILKGKLLVDISNSFNRITKKEDETTEFKARLNSFEEKIVRLQLQEESMLDRSDSMGAELTILMKELDASNRNASTVLLVKEQLLIENEDLKYQLEKVLKLLDEVKSIDVNLTCLLHEEFNLLMFDLQPDASAKFIDLNMSNMNFSNLAKFCKAIKCQSESVITNKIAKDFELLVLTSELRQMTMEFELMASQKLDIEGQRDTLYKMVQKMKGEIILNKIDVDLKNGVMYSVLVENEILKNELLKVKEEHSRANGNLQEHKKRFASTLEHVSIIDEENLKLHDMVRSSQACTARLQADVDKKCAELTHILKELELKNVENEIQIKKTHTVQMENECLKDELVEYKRKIDDYIAMIRHCYDTAESTEMTFDRMLSLTNNKILSLKNIIDRGSSEHKELTSKFVDELDFLELSSEELLSQNFFLRSELLRKDELSKGYSFDLRLLQESASIAKDHKYELEGVLESLGDELEAKSCELDEAIAHKKMLQSQLQEKNEKIGVLEFELAEKQSTVESISSENLMLKSHMRELLEMRSSIEAELTEKSKLTKKLEDDMLEKSNLLGLRNQIIEDLQDDMIKLKDEKDHLDSLVLVLKEKVEMAHALAEEHEAIATEARQIAEERRVYAADKEEEIKLLERSIEELESTINALENKAEIVRGEAERQRLKREELEMELESVRHQMLAFPASASNIWQVAEGRNLDIARHLKEKVTEVQEAQKNIEVLKKEVADKEAEILQCKAHISELNMHAEAQASEYKQKFKELEAMAQQVKADTISSNPPNLISTKSDKSAAKSRGSGSPFRCIGLGVTQQINSEKDEDLSVARRQIEELEAVAASRQKAIFMLNARLAAAESMTHDVIRDLLGVKLDMTSCAALLDRDQIQNVNETSKYADQEYHEKDQLVTKLKKQLHKFIEERESWLDEINQRHTELVSTRIALEKLQQREQFLVTENEMLKVDNGKYKKAVMELEDEVKKLSEQHNLHQRIHHHAKIKEENKLLRSHNEDLHAKLERSDSILSRVRDELARYRAACGKKPFVDIDEEEQLRKKLDDSEDERIQLAQKLMSLCTCILKVAGLSKPSSVISPLEAEDALCQIKERINSLEQEVQDLKLKCKLFCEKIWLSELKHQSLDVLSS